MKASQAIAYVQEWIDQHAHTFTGFRAAHLLGGILNLPPDGIFHPYRAIDLNIICSGASETTTHTLNYKGLILKYNIISAGQYRTSLHVLENPELAAHLAKGGILADPYAVLSPLQLIVSALYSQHSWMEVRCNQHLQRLRECLEDLRHAMSPQEAFLPLTWIGLLLSHLLAEATLHAPTCRRSLVLQRQILEQHGRLDLHNTILDILGWSRLHWRDVAWYARKSATAFDYAVTLIRTPMPFQQHMRPYVVVGAQEMIEQGYFKESMFWISRFLWTTNATIQQTAPVTKRSFFQATLDQLVSDMGLCTSADIAGRVTAIESVISMVTAMAEELMNQYCLSPSSDALWFL